MRMRRLSGPGSRAVPSSATECVGMVSSWDTPWVFCWSRAGPRENRIMFATRELIKGQYT
jgi:hypothetical protein